MPLFPALLPLWRLRTLAGGIVGAAVDTALTTPPELSQHLPLGGIGWIPSKQAGTITAIIGLALPPSY